MKQKIDYKVILLLTSISLLLIATSGGGLINGNLITSFYDLLKYLLLIACVIVTVNIIRINRMGSYLSFKENRILVFVSILYLLIKIVFSIFFKLLFSYLYVFTIIFILLRYLILTSYINYLLLLNQNKHSIKQILLNELLITSIIVIIMVLLSIINKIDNIFIKDVLSVAVTSSVLLGAYVLSLKWLKIYKILTR